MHMIGEECPLFGGLGFFFCAHYCLVLIDFILFMNVEYNNMK